MSTLRVNDLKKLVIFFWRIGAEPQASLATPVIGDEYRLTSLQHFFVILAPFINVRLTYLLT